MNSKKRFTLFLEPEVIKRLKKLAIDDGLTAQDYVEILVNEIYDEKEAVEHADKIRKTN